jgi:hypothetical protein
MTKSQRGADEQQVSLTESEFHKQRRIIPASWVTLTFAVSAHLLF